MLIGDHQGLSLLWQDYVSTLPSMILSAHFICVIVSAHFICVIVLALFIFVIVLAQFLSNKTNKKKKTC